MMREAITDRSRAVLWWPASVRPVAFLKTAFFRPQACAWRFIEDDEALEPSADTLGERDRGVVARVDDHAAQQVGHRGRAARLDDISQPPPLRSDQARTETGSVCSSATFLSRSAENTM